MNDVILGVDDALGEESAIPESKAPELPEIKTDEHGDKVFPQGSAIKSKSGEYLIDYEELASARAQRNDARAAAEAERSAHAAAKAELAELKAQFETLRKQGDGAPKQEEGAGGAELSPAEVEALLGDLSQESIANGIMEVAKRIASPIAAREASAAYEKAKQEFEQKLTPVLQSEQMRAESDYYRSILEKHADAAEIVESKEFSEWKKSLSSYARFGVERALKEGGAEDVIQVFNDFKGADGRLTHARESVKAAADKVLASIKQQAPASLSSIPGGRPAEPNPLASFDSMSLSEQKAVLDRLSPEQQAAFLEL